MTLVDLKQILRARTPRGWFGLDCGEGWYGLVADAHEQIVALFPDYEVHQIKQKFGGLRYYCSVEGDPTVASIIREAERKAWETCETCGQPGTLSERGTYVACAEHQR